MIFNRKDMTKYVYGFILGDGSLPLGKDRRNATYSLGQLATHRDYVDWQANILETLTKVRIYEYPATVDSRGYARNAQLQLRTNQLPFFTDMRERVYLDGVKRVSPHDLKLLDAEMLAILYMDDGNIWVKENIRVESYVLVEIATHSYSFGDNSLLQKAIYEKFQIPFTISPHRSKSGYVHYRLRARKDYARRFLDIVQPYILPSFEYKLNIAR